MNRHVNLPPSEEGKKLNLSSQKNDQFKAVYKQVENCDDLYEFECIYSPEIDYGEKRIIVPLTSVYNGYERFSKGTNFVNILGSSNDKPYDEQKAKKRWKDFAQLANITWECHAEKDKFYDSQKRDIPATGKDFECNGVDDNGNVIDVNIVGGHVLMETTVARRLKEGSNAYIIPICKRHNSKNFPHFNSNNKNTTPGNGNGFYMKLSSDTNVIKISGYVSANKDFQ